MAKKEKINNENSEGKEKAGNKIVTALIALVIVFIWLAIFALLIKLDVGGFGSNVLRPILKNVPVVNQILPPATDAQLANENDYPYKNLGEAVARIKELELQLDSAKGTSKANSGYISDLEAEVSRLKVFEKNQTQFEKEKKDFETNVVFNDKAPSISEYKKYYESISPTNAAKIYKQVVEQLQVDQKVQDLADRYSKMDPASAAKILEVMTGDVDLVAKILDTMKPAKSALILQNMTAEFSAKITKKMSIME
jgi:Uncharacterized conserved protein